MMRIRPDYISRMYYEITKKHIEEISGSLILVNNYINYNFWKNITYES
jgi:hypothetical protein